MNAELESVRCDICGSDNNALLLQARDYRYGYSELFCVVTCKNCGLIYLTPRPTAESILKQYKESYTPSKKKATSNRSRAMLKKILGPLGQKLSGYYGVSEIEVNGKFLDIGCACGDTLEIARDMGADVYGIELNPNSVEMCKAKGLNVYRGTLEDAPYPDSYFDVIWMSQVVEHFASPAYSLKTVNKLLKPGGRVYIFCPNAGSYLSGLFGKYWHGWHIPFHYYTFTPATIKRLATECGFVTEELNTSTPYHFFSVSVKAVLSAKNDNNFENRFGFMDSIALGIFIMPIFRILDFVFWGKGDCLKLILRKK